MAVLTAPQITSAHWYTPDGKAMHQVPLADQSGLRATNLTDARALGLYPSVTAILALLNKPGLERWKQRRVAESALVLKRQKRESDDYFIKRIMDAANEPAREAADLGLDIHREIERFFKSLVSGEKFTAVKKLVPFCAPTINWIIAKGYKVEHPEAVLINTAHGFGGTMDFPFKWRNGQGIGVLDFKSRKTEPGAAVSSYEIQPMQIAAYAATYWGEQELSRCWGANIYISSTEPGRTELISYDPAMMQEQWQNFLYLCHLWRQINRYDPRYGPTEQPAFPTGKAIVIALPGGGAPAPAADAGAAPGAEAPARTIPAGGPQRATTFLELLSGATLNETADGLDFLSPADCCAMASSANPPKTSYSWWYHQETNAGAIGLRGDAALREHGWREAFMAWPKQLAQLEAAAKPAAEIRAARPKAKGRPTPAQAETKAGGAAALKTYASKLTPAQARRLGDELEEKLVNFGRFRGKAIGELPADYLDWLRGQPQTLAVHLHLRQYLSLPHVNERIDRALKRAGKA
jgi:hypothetical protein